MMKNNENAFDRIMEEYNLENIIINEGISSETVKSNAFEQLGLGRKKKRFSKRAMISVIAAAVAAAVIGTSVIAASQFKTVFDGYLGGDDNTPVYTAENVIVNSGATDVSVKGISGDDTVVYAVLELKKKDGTPFVDTTEDTFIEYTNEQTVCFEELLVQATDEEGEPTHGYIDYDFEDNKTIKGFLQYKISDYDFRDKTLIINEQSLYAYHKEKVIYQYNEDKWDFKLYQQQQKEAEEKYTPLLKENQVIRTESLENSMYIATVTRLDVDYDISFTVNYKSEKLTIDVDKDRQYEIADMKVSFDSIEVYPSRIDFKGKGAFTKAGWIAVFGDNEFGSTLTIEMQDGTIVRASEGGFNDDVEVPNGDMFEMSFYSYVDTDKNRKVIDVNKIKSISFGEIKIYG